MRLPPIEASRGATYPSLLQRRGDYIHDHLRTREHGHARVELVDWRTHSFRYEALQIRVNSLVVLHDEQARFGLPRRTEHFVVEEIGGWGIVYRPDNLLLVLGKVTGETTDARARRTPTQGCRRRSVIELLFPRPQATDQANKMGMTQIQPPQEVE